LVEKKHSLLTYSAFAGHIPSCRWLPSKGECGDGKAEENSPFLHTLLSRCTYPAIAVYLREGECGEGKVKVKWR